MIEKKYILSGIYGACFIVGVILFIVAVLKNKSERYDDKYKNSDACILANKTDCSDSKCCLMWDSKKGKCRKGTIEDGNCVSKLKGANLVMLFCGILLIFGGGAAFIFSLIVL
jgi:hypothetical protein